MADFQTRTYGASAGLAIDAGLRAHMNKVYGTMSVGMLVTAAAAWAISGLAVTDVPGSAEAVQIGASTYLTGMGEALYLSPLKWVVMFLPLVMVFGFSAAVPRLSAAAAQLFFYVFATAMGVSLSSIFLIYTGGSIASTFLATSASFAALSLYGYTTKRDLSGFGSFLMMGVVGLMVASIVNIFLGSGALAFTISFIGVLLFAGLTVYDTQAIKVNYVQHARGGDQEWLEKSAIMGALTLYLDFINLFTFLLQFLGQKNE
jgi:FtsH-binding integral membrane protein